MIFFENHIKLKDTLAIVLTDSQDITILKVHTRKHGNLVIVHVNAHKS